MKSALKDPDWFASILRYMSDAVIAVDKKGFVAFMNPPAEHLTGLSERKAIGTPLKEVFQLFNPETHTTLRIPTPRYFRHKHKPYSFKHSILVAQNGEEIPVNAVITPIKGYGGVINGCVFVFRNIRKELIEERTEQDEQKIEATMKMAGSIAYDYSNRLSIICGHASAIVDNVLPKTRAHEEALRILEVVEHASGLTRRIMSVARAANISDNTKIERVNLREVIKESISLVKGSFTETKIFLKVLNYDTMPYVNANSVQLLDCVMHLLHNAADAMHNGGTITIDVAEKRIGNRTFAVLRVRDNGSGMDKDIIDRIFEPFFSTKKEKVAIGVGLTVVRNSVERWGGFVRVRSRPAHGTSVRLFMPKAKLRAGKDIKHGTGGETILLADDRKDSLVETSEILSRAGYKVHAARNGEECLSVYKKHADEIKLSIIDVVMPRKDGRKVLREIMEIDPLALVIMTSGFSRDYVRTYLERGAWEFIQKPFDREHLLSMVRRVLDQEITD